MPTTKRKHLRDSYRFPYFYPGVTVSGLFGDRHGRVIRLTRRSKKRSAGHAVVFVVGGTIAGCAEFAICRAEGYASIWSSTFGESSAGSARV